MKRLKYLAMAALVAFAACDEGDEVVTTPPPATGSVTGQVTIDGNGAAGVTVTLNGSDKSPVTTGADGRYTFSDVLAGGYTVTISGTPADATFGSMTAGVVIQTAGQVATADFSGAYIRTSAVTGSVTGDGMGLANVTVTLTSGGTTVASATTGSSGAFVFAGLRAGSYSVSIAGFDAAQWDFASTSMGPYTVAVGATQDVAFAGTRKATAQIIGTVSLTDGPAAGVTVTLSDGTTSTNATTNAQGGYGFQNLLPGNYTVSVSNLPADAVFSPSSYSVQIAAAGEVKTQNFAGTYNGTASLSGVVSRAGVALQGVTVTLSGGPSTAAAQTTGANGAYSFTGLRAGTYTATISGFDATQVQFTATSQTNVLAVGEAATASFNGTIPSNSTITGMVMVDGAAAAGVVVHLNPNGGDTSDEIPFTTGTDGRYTYNNLPVGNHTVRVVSGFAADVSFAVMSQPASITDAQQTITVPNFVGTVDRTASISGAVSTNEGPLNGATVTLTGGELTTPRTTTTASGAYSFTGLRANAGDYTVAISGYDTSRYDFSGDATSKTVTGLASGGSATVNFTGAVFATATISGRLYVDADGDNTSDGTTAEPTLTAAAGMTLTLTGGDVATTKTATVAADGTYSFMNLAPGNYTVALDTSTGVPANYVFGGTSSTVLLSGATTLTVGGTQTVDFPFDIQSQTITVQAFVGADENASGFPTATKPASRVSALAGVTVTLYDTYANAVAAGATGVLGTANTATAANGGANFTFLRTADASPQGGTDNIVFARLTGVPANYIVNGEQIIEVSYDPLMAADTAADAFDFINTRVRFNTRAQETDGDALQGWNVNIFQTDNTVAVADTTVAVSVVATTTGGASAGNMATQTFLPASLNFGGTPANFAPAVYYVRLDRTAGAQSSGHAYTVDPAPGTTVTEKGDFLIITFDGTHANSIVDIGDLNVRYSDVSIYGGVYHEVDEVAGPGAGDNLVGVQSIAGELRSGDGATVIRPATAAIFGVGTFPAFEGVPTTVSGANATYQLRARPGVPGQNVIVTDSIHTVSLDGSDSTYVATASPSGPGAYGTFGHKYSNLSITGQAQSALAAGIQNVIVTIAPNSPNIGGTATRKDTTNAGGAYSFTGIVEGKYTVSIDNPLNDGSGNPLWKFENRINNNLSATSDTATVLGLGGTAAINFEGRFQQTNIRGTVVNDRDGDGNQLDPNEALANAVIEAIEDLDNDGVVDANEAVVKADTTDANGAYSFSMLPEGNYLIRGNDVGTTEVLRSVTGTGTINRLIAVSTTSAVTTVGSTTSFPAWNYDASTVGGTSQATDFTFLFNDTQITATFQTGAAAAVANMTVTVRKCVTNVGSFSPPAAGTCTTYDTTFGTGGQQNPVTNASGQIQITGLREGVYEVTPNPVTAGFTTSVPANRLFRLVDTQDIENATFVIS